MNCLIINFDMVMKGLGQRSRTLASVYWRMSKIRLDSDNVPGRADGEALWGGSEVL